MLARTPEREELGAEARANSEDNVKGSLVGLKPRSHPEDALELVTKAAKFGPKIYQINAWTTCSREAPAGSTGFSPISGLLLREAFYSTQDVLQWVLHIH